MSWFYVTPPCLELGLRAGAVIVRHLRIADRSAELASEIATAVADVRGRFPNLADARELAELQRFREIHRRVGARPSKQIPSVENLLKYVFRRGDLPAINNLVDAYNLVSLRTFCSLGAHDLGRIQPPVNLQLLDGTEPIVPLGSTTAVTVGAGEFGYVDAARF